MKIRYNVYIIEPRTFCTPSDSYYARGYVRCYELDSEVISVFQLKNTHNSEEEAIADILECKRCDKKYNVKDIEYTIIKTYHEEGT